jgi:hypothetical protein
MEFIPGQIAYPDANPQSNCAVPLLVSYLGRNVGESEQRNADAAFARRVMNGGAGVLAMQAQKNVDERATGFWSRTGRFFIGCCRGAG